MRLIGHRGARFEAPENTLPGFQYALDMGIDSFEFDVHLTKDNELVVIHDASVDRTTNGSGLVSEMTLAEIQALDARAEFTDWPGACRIPTLHQLLELIHSADYLEIEIKTDAPERLDRVAPMVIDAIHAFDLAGRAFITSFDVYALEAAQRVDPAIRRGLIGAWDDDRFRDEATRLAISLAGVPYATATPALVDWAKSAGILTTGWPTNSPEQLARALELGVDAVCTDAPTTIRSLLLQQTGVR